MARITLDEASRILGVSREAVRRLVIRDVLPGVHRGGRWWVGLDDVEARLALVGKGGQGSKGPRVRK